MRGIVLKCIIYYSVILIKKQLFLRRGVRLGDCMIGRIEQMARGVFRYETLKLVMPEEPVKIVLKKAETYTGKFSMKEENDRLVKGEVYSSSPRMQVLNPEFKDSTIEIEYIFDAAGMLDREEAAGSFWVISDAGEYELPFLASVRQQTADKAILPVDTLEAFVKLAAEDYEEAYRFFVRRDFEQLLNDRDQKYREIYRGCLKTTTEKQVLEGFLVAAGLKPNARISIDSYKIRCYKSDTTEEKVLPIRKSVPGYQNVRVSADVPWIIPDTPLIHSGTFHNDLYELHYRIDAGLMHSGKNFGRITLEAPGQELAYEVEVAETVYEDVRRKRERRLEVKRRQLRLMQLYMDFKQRKIPLKTWTDHSREEIEWLEKADDRNVFYVLVKIQLLLAERNNEEARHMLNKLDGNAEIKAQPEARGYYLYLQSLYSRDRSYINKVSFEVKELCGKCPGSWKLLWVLLYMDENLERNQQRKLELIEQRFVQGCFSPMIYLEAYDLIRKNPGRLNKLKNFELQILSYAVKHGVVTREIAERVSLLAAKYKKYEEILYRILIYCYREFEMKDTAAAICSLLIKGNVTDTGAFEWYALGVEQELKITRLYEYYMYALPQDYAQPLPQQILLYFAYHSQLDYRKKAQLYANVIRYREQNLPVYQKFVPLMERFALEQLMERRINENLAEVYQQMLKETQFTGELARALADVLFTCRLNTEDTKVKYATVLHPGLDKERRVPVLQGTAYVRLYTKNAVVLLDDGEEHWCEAFTTSQCIRVMKNGDFLEKCKELAGDHMGILLHVCEEQGRPLCYNDETIAFYEVLSVQPGISRLFRQQLRSGILNYYFENSEGSDPEGFLETCREEMFPAQEAHKLTEILIERGKYPEAYTAVNTYGYERVPLRMLVKLCARLVMMNDYEPDRYLLGLCAYVWENSKYDAVILQYLLACLKGPQKQLFELWNCARKFEIDTYEFEERVLMQILFTEQTSVQGDTMFLDYCRKGPKHRLASAYLAWESWLYIMQGKKPDAPVMDLLAREYRQKERLSDMCLLAILAWAGEKEALSDEEQKMALEIIRLFAERDMYFAIYQELKKKIRLPQDLSRNTYLEYRTDEKSSVIFSYTINSGDARDETYSCEEMKHMLEGIFVIGIPMFYGETLQYYFTEIRSDGTKIKSDIGFYLQGASDTVAAGMKYDMLNAVLMLEEEEETGGMRPDGLQKERLDKLTDRMKEYQEVNMLTEHLFELKE